MRDVSVFLAPDLFRANTHLVESLKKNEIQVSCFDVKTEMYDRALASHKELLFQEFGRDLSSPLLCLAFEDTKLGVMEASKAGITVLGIGQNKIELDRFVAWGAHAVALSVSDLLESFHVKNYYQIQYLPYAIHLRRINDLKLGYPVALLDTVRGKIIKDDFEDDDDDDDDQKGAFRSEEETGHRMDECNDNVVIDQNAEKIIPREVLGIQPGTLADVYINNVGWPQDKIDNFHFNSRELERDIIQMFAKLYGVDRIEMRGYVTNGGTEGNFSGLWWQRDYLKNESNGNRPILLTSDQTHYSVSKAAQQLDIDGRLVKTTKTGEIDCADLSLVLDDISQKQPNRPILVNINFGTTQTGALDDLPAVYKILVEKVESRGVMFSIHVDAALMGAVIPCTDPFGKVNYFKDFNVNTIAISGHKFFGSVTICGICLTTDSFLKACFSRKEVNVQYLTGLHDITPSGSRSGFNVLSLHNTLCGLYLHTNAHRLRQIVAQCYRNVDYFIAQITKLIPSEQIIHPKHSLTVCFTPPPSLTTMDKYSVMPVKMPLSPTTPYAGVCLLINVGPTMINHFLAEYRRDLAKMKVHNERHADAVHNKVGLIQ
mmetsp:Transcript_32107/g.53718  ORF Transcript_32107/g.53718 Transcript_32107/m.53718 type:complete len:600 (+) Transcript_32107:170-1969(+)